MLGATQMTELEFLYYAGYNEKAKTIYKEQYEEPMKPYYQEYAEYEKELEIYNSVLPEWNKNNIQTTEVVSKTDTRYVDNDLFGLVALTFFGSGLWGTIDGLICLIGNDDGDNDDACSRAGTAWIICGSSFLLIFVVDDKVSQEYTYKKTITTNSIEPPARPYAPYDPNLTITQVYTNQQITSLAESYNRRLYEEIKNQ
jgi:hypothetical protein